MSFQNIQQVSIFLCHSSEKLEIFSITDRFNVRRDLQRVSQICSACISFDYFFFFQVSLKDSTDIFLFFLFGMFEGVYMFMRLYSRRIRKFSFMCLVTVSQYKVAQKNLIWLGKGLSVCQVISAVQLFVYSDGNSFLLSYYYYHLYHFYHYHYQQVNKSSFDSSTVSYDDFVFDSLVYAGTSITF